MTVLFVCTGNTCRSPMAAGIAKKIAADSGIDITVGSAGLFAYSGDTVNEKAVTALNNFGIDISENRARRFTAYDADNTDRIYVMTKAHKDALIAAFPECITKTFTLSEKDISDPYGQSQEVYNQCAEELKKIIESIFEDLKGQLK